MDHLVEYYAADNAIYTFVISRHNTSPRVVTLPYEYGDLSRLVVDFQRSLWQRSHAEAIASVLGDLLLLPLRERSLINDGDVLCIAPHRCLHAVPFSAIGAGTECTLFRNAVAYVPSGALLPALLRPTVSSGKAIVVKHNRLGDGPEIQESFTREAQQIGELLGAQLLEEGEDVLEQLRTCLPSARVVHFTCHAQFDPRRRDRSGLVLWDGRGGDRLVSIAELAALPIQAELVAFGGCETGRGEQHAGDERIGLVRAALTAGARSVLATLWPVDSIAAERLLPAFYNAWIQGHSRAESLRLAQLKLHRATSPSDQRDNFVGLEHWAPYVLVGNWR